MVSPEKNDKDSSIHKNSKKVKIPTWIVIAITVIVVSFIAILISNNRMLNGSNANYNPQNSIQTTPSQSIIPEKQCRDIQVPYDSQESYEEREAYNDLECHQQSFDYYKQVTSCKKSLLMVGDARTECTVVNKEQDNGLFKIKVGIKCKDGQWSTSEIKKPIQGYGTEKHDHKALSFCDTEDCTCEVTPPTKQACEQVTKYRTITKYRPVTKYKTEQRCE